MDMCCPPIGCNEHPIPTSPIPTTTPCIHYLVGSGHAGWFWWRIYSWLDTKTRNSIRNWWPCHDLTTMSTNQRTCVAQPLKPSTIQCPPRYYPQLHSQFWPLDEIGDISSNQQLRRIAQIVISTIMVLAEMWKFMGGQTKHFFSLFRRIHRPSQLWC